MWLIRSVLGFRHGQRFALATLWVLAFAVSAWIAADIFWRLAAPRPLGLPSILVSDPEQAAGRVVAQHWMGHAQATAAPVPSGHVVLHGLATGSPGHPGFAVLSIDGGVAQGVVETEEVKSGLVLARILPDRVELRSADGATTLVPLSADIKAEPVTSPQR